ncbi:MAG TPA: FUSC family protein, partial [Candidatus Acidoferrum sp.]|nr:FUSC family protein [Candidatus Acidoferrum sp.]
GSMLGGVLAALLLLELHSTAALTAAVFPLAALTMAVRSINYSLFVVFLTPLFVLTVDVMHPGAKDLSLVGLRVLNNLVGGIVALVSSLVLWPIWEPGRLRELIADAVDANARYASLAFAPDHDEGVLTEARRRAGLASSNAEAARERGAIEAWWRREALQGAVPVLLLVRGVAGIATAAWLDPRLERRGSQAADWLREEGAALSARLCGEDVKPLAPPDLRDDVDATRCIQQMLLVEAAVERFISAQSGSRRIGTRDAAA